MIALLLTIFITYLVVCLFGYVIHWGLHQNWSGKYNISHMAHHQKLYPPWDYLSDTYRSADKDNSAKFFAITAIPLIALPIVLMIFNILPIYLGLTCLAMEGILGFLHNYLHDSFHIRDHWLTRAYVFKHVFNRWNELHFNHHIKMSTNFGIFVFMFDRLFGTFWGRK